MEEKQQPSQVEIPESIFKKWQNIVDIMAEIIGVPAALIMRLEGSELEVFVSSQSVGNPYHPGEHMHFLTQDCIARQ